MMKLWQMIVVSGLLSGCAAGPLAEGNPLVRLGGVFNPLTAALAGGEDPAPATARGPLTREAIEAAPTNLLRLSLISLESTDVLSEIGQNGTSTTWGSRDGLTFTFDGGLLVATRGVGSDLMGADVSAAKRSLSGGGSHSRVHEFLTGLDQPAQINFQCRTVVTGTETITIVERAYTTSILEETCAADAFSFKNTYWRDQFGVIWQSRQFLSPQLGYLGYQRF